MKSSPLKVSKQKLSPLAAKRKAAADLAMAKTPYRRAAKQRHKEKRTRTQYYLKVKIGIIKTENINPQRKTEGITEKELSQSQATRLDT